MALYFRDHHKHLAKEAWTGILGSIVLVAIVVAIEKLVWRGACFWIGAIWAVITSFLMFAFWIIELASMNLNQAA